MKQKRLVGEKEVMKRKKITKEEKEQQKIRLKNIQKNDKVTKIILLILIGVMVFKFLTCIIMYFNKSFAFFYIKNIINNISGLIYYLSSFIPYASYLFITIYFIVLLIVLIYQCILINTNKYDVLILNKKYNKSNRILYVLMFILFYYFITNMQISHLPIMDDLNFKDTKDKTYEIADLEHLIDYLSLKVEYYASTLERDENNQIVFDGDYNKQVVNDLNNVSNKLPLLSGLYPHKSDHLNNTLKGLVGSNTIGLTHMYSTYFDYNIDPISIISTMTHEYCHTKSYLRENETTMCSYVAGINSSSKISNYAAYLEAYGRAIRAYQDIDYHKSLPLLDRITSQCLLNNYQELCEVYVKLGSEFIPGSYELYVKTYSLKNYQNYKDELIKSLTILKENGYELKSVMTRKTIDLKKIEEMIDNKSDDAIYIDGDLTKKKFNIIKEAFKNDKLYMSIYQINYEEETSDELKKNPTKYYLAPFKKDYDNIINSFSKITNDYTYERVVRLILEYHEEYGYN